MVLEEAEALSGVLRDALQDVLVHLERGGWQLERVSPRLLMGTHMPVVAFRRGNETVCFIITPTDPIKPAYKRSTRFDLVYFSEDVADERQSEIYRRDREFIDRFASWLRAWDR
jgi:hypothetical protein